jgi:hypothetical protein
MNCTNCNAPLEAQARFCPNCGATVAQVSSAPRNAAPNPAPLYQPISSVESPTIQPSGQRQPQPSLQPQQPPFQQQAQWQPQQPGQQQIVLPAAPRTQTQGYAPPRSPQTLAAPSNTPRKRRGGCLMVGLIVLVILLVLVAGGWFFGVRPYLNSMAQSKLNNVLTQAINNIPAQVSLLPAGQVKIPVGALNNLLVLSSSPSDIVQNPHLSITPNNMQFTFQVYGMTSTATAVPTVSNGHLVVTNMTISGIAGLILSPDELTTIVNQHLADAQSKINHTITAVQLKNQELDLTLGARSGNGTQLPTGVPTALPTGLPTGLP